MGTSCTPPSARPKWLLNLHRCALCCSPACCVRGSWVPTRPAQLRSAHARRACLSPRHLVEVNPEDRPAKRNRIGAREGLRNERPEQGDAP